MRIAPRTPLKNGPLCPSLPQEFKDFALKGTMIDLPVAVIIGAAFGKVVDSLVKHILMPLVGLVLPGEWGYLRWEVVAGAKEVPYGLFLAEVVTFLVVALALFLFVAELRGWATKARKGEAAAPPLLTRDQEPPTEIRDLLKRGPAS